MGVTYNQTSLHEGNARLFFFPELISPFPGLGGWRLGGARGFWAITVISSDPRPSMGLEELLTWRAHSGKLIQMELYSSPMDGGIHGFA